MKQKLENKQHHTQKNFNFAYEGLQKKAKNINQTYLNSNLKDELIIKLIETLYDRYTMDLYRFKKDLLSDVTEKKYNVTFFKDPYIEDGVIKIESVCEGINRYISSDKSQKIYDLLNENPNTPIAYEEPIGMSISHGYIEVLNILLKHYEKTKLNGNPESIEYKYAKRQLFEIIEEALPYADDPKILEIIKPYCAPEEDSESDRASDLDREFALEHPEEEKTSNSDEFGSRSSSMSNQSSNDSSESRLTFENLRAHTESFLTGENSNTSEVQVDFE